MHPFRQFARPDNTRAFTLIEVLVASAILMIILAMLMTMVNQTTKLWSSTTGSIQDFQRARQAFDIVAGRISQATLNTYWDYRRTGDVPTEYIRQSDLRFLSGQAATLLGSGDPRRNPGQAVFFQAPGGVRAAGGDRAMPGSLNTWGYFIEYGSDRDFRPGYLDGIIPERRRFRLFEMMEPSDALTIYTYTSGSSGSGYTGKEWYTGPLGNTSYRRIIADNVIAMIIHPKLSPDDDETGSKLSSNYGYDTTLTASDATINPKNQLPPLVEIVLVVIDERSAARLQWTETPPDFGQGELFLNASRDQQLRDLDALEAQLQKAHLAPRRFTLTVPLRAARWSTNQTH